MTKTTLLITLLAFSLTYCRSQPTMEAARDISTTSGKQDAINKFWKWFQTNEKKLRGFERNPDKILGEVLDNAKQIENGLAIEFEPPNNNIVNVTISADGDRNLFPIVKQIVEKAPKIQGWNFIAFRQRMPADKLKTMVLKVQDHELSPAKMKFFPIVSGDSLDIIVYINQVTEKNFNQMAYAMLTLMDNILGEYDCVTKVRSYDLQKMPTKKEELDGLQPLLDLTAYVDRFHQSKHH